MEIHQVRYFLSVAETHNFTRAAERCGVSQPALTSGIKKLEAELGGDLFVRARAGVRLTALGQLVHPKLERMMLDVGATTELARNYRIAQQVPLRVGVLETIGAPRLVPFLMRFAESAPGVELEMVQAGQRGILAGLEDGSFETAISTTIEDPPPWAVTSEVYREAFVVVLPPAHPLKREAALDLEMLDGESYVDRLACEQRGLFAEVCRERRVELIPTHRSEHDAWVESLVNASMGVAFMPHYSLSNPATVQRPLRDPHLVRTICLHRSADVARTPAGKLFWAAFRT